MSVLSLLAIVSVLSLLISPVLLPDGITKCDPYTIAQDIITPLVDFIGK